MTTADYFIQDKKLRESFLVWEYRVSKTALQNWLLKHPKPSDFNGTEAEWAWLESIGLPFEQ